MTCLDTDDDNNNNNNNNNTTGGMGISSSDMPDDDVIYCEEYKPPFLVALVLVFPIMPLFWTYGVKITTRTSNDTTPSSSSCVLRFGYNTSLTSKTVTSLSQIKEAIPISNVNSLTDGWGGWGIRYRFRHGQFQTGYIAKNGGAVQITLMPPSSTNHETKTYVFSCQDPEKVCKMLLKNNVDSSQAKE